MTKSSAAKLFVGLIVFSYANVLSLGCLSHGNSGASGGGSGASHGGSSGGGGSGASHGGSGGGGGTSHGGSGGGGTSHGGSGGGGSGSGQGGAGGGGSGGNQGGSGGGVGGYWVSDAGVDARANGDANADTRVGSDADGATDGNTITEECAEGTDLIYVVDQNNMFYSFNPRAAPSSAFQQVGTGPLACPSGGQPFSMSVDRYGWAYVLFVQEDGLFTCVGINKVDILTGTCKGLIPFTCGTSGYSTFGMGYVTDGPSTYNEKLYIANADSPSQLATLDVKNGAVSVISTIAYVGAEFTGNSLGELWGFFPRETTPIVAQIDKTNGQAIAGKIFPLSGLTNNANAWAFAHWGGSYYIFYKTFSDSTTNVYKLQGSVMTTHLANSGKYIVGAGVSICAPTGE